MTNIDTIVKPNLIIGGVFKAGTTSLFSYLSVHEDISTSSKKELGYFVPLQFGEALSPIKDYLKFFKHIKKKCTYVLEASPGYLYGGCKIANSMKQVLGDFKIIFVLREPKDRLISFYKYLKTSYVFAYGDTLSKDQIKFIKEMTFEKYVNESLKYLNNPAYKDASEAYCLSGIGYSLYSCYLKEWYDVIGEQNIKVIFFDTLKNSQLSLMQEICEWLDISHSVYENYSFVIQNKTRNIDNKIIHEIASRINKNIEPILRSYPKLKNKLRDIYYYFNCNNDNDNDNEYDIGEYANTIFNNEKKDLKLLLSKHGNNEFPSWITRYV